MSSISYQTVFIYKLFYLQTIVTPTFGSNLPLWTISCEFWYYILWALLILLAARFIEYIAKKNKKNAFLFIGNLLICIVVTAFIPIGFLKYFPIWILGAAIRLIPTSKSKNFSVKHTALLIFSILILIIATAYSNLKMTLVGYYFVGICFSWILLLIASLRLQVFESFFLKIKNPVKLLSDFSFSLYALHYPFQLLILSTITESDLLRTPLKKADLQGWIYLIIIMLIVYTYSYIVYFFTERNTGYLRNRMFFLYDKYKLIFSRN
jgi:peptidoglycan/LPS O-acetylase OafA/YrhL